MKVFVPDDWNNLKNKLREIGKTVEIKKESNKYLAYSDYPKVIIEQKNLRKLLEVLADLEYEYAALLSFDERDVEFLGFEVKKVKDLDDVLNTSEFESLKSLLTKIKSSKGSEECGAIGIFIGFVRKMSNGKEVKKLKYEVYDEVFNAKIKEIEERLKKYPGVVNVKIYHHTGTLLPGEDIVYIVIIGKHRKDIWKPLEDGIELIKSEVPIWKKEVFSDHEIWVHDKIKSNK